LVNRSGDNGKMSNDDLKAPMIRKPDVLGNAQNTKTSPHLTQLHLTISPNFAQDSSGFCVFAYFYFRPWARRQPQALADQARTAAAIHKIPDQICHISPHHTATTATRLDQAGWEVWCPLRVQPGSRLVSS